MRQPVLAILGGQGPLATLRFQQALLQRALARGAVADRDFLATLTLALPSDLTADGCWNAAGAKAFIDTNIEVVNSSPATHLVMPCNTMHEYEAYLRSRLHPHIEFISTRAVVLGTVRNAVEIWASQETVTSGIYDELLIHGARYATDTARVQRAIMAGMAGHGMIGADLEKLPAAVLLACTDLSLHASLLRQRGVQVIDSLELLVNEVWEQLG